MSNQAGTGPLLQLHDHACHLHEGVTDQLDVAAPFICEGLQRGEQCLVSVAEGAEAGQFRAALSARGVDVEGASHAGALSILDASRVQLRGTPFAPEPLLGLFEEANVQARRAGFMGLRVLADMTWTRRDHPGTKRFVELESRVNDLFLRHAFTALCQYRVGAFPAADLCEAIRTHPKVVLGGVARANPFYVPPAELLAKSSADVELDRLLRTLAGHGPAAREATGMVPICSCCKRIRERDGRWERFEHFLMDRCGLTFTHGLCPRCEARYQA